jgi:hypothetical protein
MSRRLAVVVAVAVVASAACGGSRPTLGRAAPATAPVATSSTVGSVPPGAPAETGPAKGGAAPARSQADLDAASSAWARWADAVRGGDLNGAAGLSRDAANSWSIVTAVVAGADGRAGAPHRFSGSVTPGSAASASGGAVTVTGRLEVREQASNGFDRTFVVDQAVVRQVDRTWVVETFRLDGVALRWSAVGMSRVVSGVKLEWVALLGLHGSTWAITRATLSAGSRSLAAGPAHLRTREGADVVAQAALFSADAQPVGVWRFPESVAVATGAVTLRDGGGDLSFSFG